MANKKGTSTKNKTKNSSAIEREENLKKIEEVSGDNLDLMHIMRVAAIIVVVFCLFYFFTVFLTNRDKVTENNKSETFISYVNTIAGRSFSLPESEYYVVYYDSSDESLKTSITGAATTYRAKEKHLALYQVDMHDSLNQKYVAESSNKNPNSVSELAINGPTLIHFSNGKVVEYIEGKDNIVNHLS